MTALRVVARIAGWIGFWHLLLLLDRWFGWRRQIVVLKYHHISDPEESSRAMSGLQTGTPADVFAEQMRVVSRWYRPIDIHTFEKLAYGKEKLDRDSVLVTFDDAYSSVHFRAAPSLKRHQIVGHVFVATDYIDSERRFWWVRVADFMHRVTLGDWHMLGVRCDQWPAEIRDVFLAHSIDDLVSRRRASQSLLSVFDTMQDRQHDYVLDGIESVVAPPRLTSLPLSGWSDLHEMSNDGFTLGAHSHTHPRLSQLTGDEVMIDLALSEQAWKEHGFPGPTTFAYPSGDFNSETGSLLKKAGYRLSFATTAGFIAGRAEDPMLIPRVCLGNRVGAALMARLAQFTLRKYLPRRNKSSRDPNSE